MHATTFAYSLDFRLMVLSALATIQKLNVNVGASLHRSTRDCDIAAPAWTHSRVVMLATP
jgi:hypothetical protein